MRLGRTVRCRSIPRSVPNALARFANNTLVRTHESCEFSPACDRNLGQTGGVHPKTETWKMVTVLQVHRIGPAVGCRPEFENASRTAAVVVAYRGSIDVAGLVSCESAGPGLVEGIQQIVGLTQDIEASTTREREKRANLATTFGNVAGLLEYAK